MTLQEKLESAARGAGYDFEWMCRGANNPNGIANVPCVNGEEWHPDTDDGDSRRLEVALRKHCFTDHPRPFEAWPEHIQILWERYSDATDSGDAEQYRAAVLDLAAEIGRAINAA